MLLQRFNQEILGVSRSEPTLLDANFYIKDGLIGPRHENCFNSPLSILEFLSVIKATPEAKGLDADCIRQLRNARRKFQSAYYCTIAECRSKFIELVSDPSFFDLGWDIMYQTGILQSYLPEWDKIVGMMQFDLFHAYTVDEHTHRLVKYVRRYYLESDEFPRCARIVKNIDEHRVLFIAAIFHDIAKGRDGDHSKLGAKDVYDFCLNHEIPEKQTHLIAWLVEQHLLMSVVAQRRDIYDPEVIKDFASEVKSHTHLDLLYALTLADIRATNDNLWNDWKASLLRELYLLTHQALDNGFECQRTFQERVDEHKELALDRLRKNGVDAQLANPFWSQMRNDYFARFKPKQIAWHTETILKAGKLEPEDIIVAASNQTTKAGTELLIYGHDRPALFAQIASVLDSRNCSIHDAQIVVTDDGYVFDSMIILDQNSDRIESENRVKILAQAVHQQLVKPGRSHKNQRRMSRQMKQLDVTTKVRFYSSQDDATLVELEALDAPGLLARIGHLFVDLNITLKMAKIATIGERAEDVFIVCNAEGKALTQSQQLLLKKQLIIKLDQPEVNTAI
jgi:[protein-PII] uridylyltransferase